MYWTYPILPYGIVACTFFPTTFLEIAVYKPFSRTPRQVRCSGNSFLSGDTMKNNNCPRVHCNIGFCCRNVTFSENNFTTPRNNGLKCFKINVTWGRVKFKTKHDRVNEVWKNESWPFFPELSDVANVLKPINLQKAARYAFVYVPLLHGR